MDLRKLAGIVIVVILLIAALYVIYQPESDTPAPDEVTAKELLEASVLGGDYLINATNDDGSFIYSYNAMDDTESSSYNILRHAGTIYSMLQLYNETKNNLLLDASEQAISYLLSFSKVYGDGKAIVYEDTMKLGGNGLAIIALAEYTKVTGDQTHIEIMQEFAKYIKFSQMSSGEFISKRTFSTGEISDFVSQYYPGEALLALCRLYALDGNETWLNVAEKGAYYLITVRDANVSTYDLLHDHWLLMALNELYRYRSDPLYLNQSMRIAESIMYKQRDGIEREAEEPEWLGSYYTPPRSTPTATRSEGLIAAYLLATDFGDAKMAERILNATKLGVAFQLRTQITEETSEDLPNPQKALGGFRASLTSYEIRIDYVQHNICSILGLYQIIT